MFDWLSDFRHLPLFINKYVMKNEREEAQFSYLRKPAVPQKGLLIGAQCFTMPNVNETHSAMTDVKFICH